MFINTVSRLYLLKARTESRAQHECNRIASVCIINTRSRYQRIWYLRGNIRGECK